METKKEKLSIPKTAKALDAFLSGKPAEEDQTKKEITWQFNLRFNKEEEDEIKKGHEDCLDKMPMYEYQINAIREKARKDSAKRQKLNQAIKDLEE